MTGQEILNYFKQKSGYAYTGSLSSTSVANRLFRDALFSVLEKKYEQLINQKEYDELKTIIKTEKTFNPTSNILNLTNDITDYWHLLTVRAKFTDNVGISIKDASNEFPVQITVDKRSNMRTGEQIEISGVGGNTSANGTFFIKKKSDFKFLLFQDKDFINPVAGNGVYTSGGQMKRILYNYCEKVYSDQKTGVFSAPTKDSPGQEIADDSLKIYPLDEACTEVTVDYLSLPPANAIIDVSNNSIDLTAFYPEKLQYYIIDEARIIFAQKYRDAELLQNAATSQVVNP